MRLIDADELCEGRVENDPVRIATECAPTIEAVPVVHGEWVANDIGIYFCSNCDSEAYWDTDYGQQFFDWCPYCGADMRKKV